jgi:hypothetical protein
VQRVRARAPSGPESGSWGPGGRAAGSPRTRPTSGSSPTSSEQPGAPGARRRRPGLQRSGARRRRHRRAHDPPGGRIVRERAGRRRPGCSGDAPLPVPGRAPRPSPDDRAAAILLGLSEAALGATIVAVVATGGRLGLEDVLPARLGPAPWRDRGQGTAPDPAVAPGAGALGGADGLRRGARRSGWERAPGTSPIPTYPPGTTRPARVVGSACAGARSRRGRSWHAGWKPRAAVAALRPAPAPPGGPRRRRAPDVEGAFDPAELPIWGPASCRRRVWRGTRRSRRWPLRAARASRSRP